VVTSICYYFPNETWFHLNASLDMQNKRYWLLECPRLIQKGSLHDNEVGV
jgi:hypothetical protein